MVSAIAAITAIGILVAGCGSAAVTDLPPAAEPAESPPPSRAPAGRVIRVGSAPEGVAADPVTGIVAVALRTPDEIALVDGRSGVVVKRVGVPESARHLALDGSDVLVPSERANVLARVSLPDGEVTRIDVGPYPHDAVAAGGRVFVGDERDRTLSVVDGDRKVGEIRAAVQPGGLAAMEDGRVVVAVSVRERVIEAYDSRTLKPLGRADAGVGPTHVVSDGKNLAYVTDTAGGAVLVVRLRPRLEITRRVHVPGSPYGIALDRERDRLWVTTTKTNELVMLTGDGRPRPLATFPTVQQADTVAVDESTGRVFVTGRVAGTLQLLDAP